MKVFVCLLLVACTAAVNQETFRGRLNPRGTQTAENLARNMIRKVNDLIKQFTKVNNMQIGPVTVESFRVQRLDTSNINIIMDRNRLGVKVNNGAVHLTAQLAVYIDVLFGKIRVGGQFDTYGDAINAQLDSGIGVRGGKFYSQGMNCHLSVGRPRVDLHIPIINHLANMVLQGLMPAVTKGVCNGVKLYGNGMVNSVFQALPNNINVFNLFRLEFPVRNFRSWSRHMVAGVGMEVRPVSNRAVSNAGLRILALPEAEDSHMACGSISDYVVNTAGRTFLPVGKSFSMEVSSILQLFFGSIFGDKIFAQGTLTQSPLFLIEPNEMVFTVKASGRLLDKAGNVVPGTETKPIEFRVSTATNQTPMFKSVLVQIKGPIHFELDVNLAKIIDFVVSLIDGAFRKSGRLQKRATNGDITRVMNEMFFSKWFSGFSLALSTRHGALVACVSGNPNGNAVNKVYGALRQSFYRG